MYYLLGCRNSYNCIGIPSISGWYQDPDRFEQISIRIGRSSGSFLSGDEAGLGSPGVTRLERKDEDDPADPARGCGRGIVDRGLVDSDQDIVDRGLVGSDQEYVRVAFDDRVLTVRVRGGKWGVRVLLALGVPLARLRHELG